MNNIPRFVIILFLVNLAAASILAGAYNITRPKIEEEEALIKEGAMREVMPESIADRFEPVEIDGDIKFWSAFKGPSAKPAGYVFIAARYGYSSLIETMVGMKEDGAITGVKIVSQNETPGLGSRIIEVISDMTIAKAVKGIFSEEKGYREDTLPYFTEQFKGKDVRVLEFSKGGIQAITGATISSKACLESIREKGSGILD